MDNIDNKLSFGPKYENKKSLAEAYGRGRLLGIATLVLWPLLIFIIIFIAVFLALS